MIKIAEDIGNTKVTNLVLIGILNQLFNIASDESFIEATKENIDARFHAINIDGYKRGKALNLEEFNSPKTLENADVCRIKVD